MKNLVLLGLVVILTCCDPPNILLVKNNSEKEIGFRVQTRDPIRFESIPYSDTLIEDQLIKMTSVSKLLSSQLPIHSIDSVNYSFILKPQHEVMIAPASIGFPWRKVSYTLQGKYYELLGDSVSYGSNVELKNKSAFLPIKIVQINNP